jgi:hypothetical protein
MKSPALYPVGKSLIICLALLASSMTLSWAQILSGSLTNGLIAHYKFDSNLIDSSSQGNALIDSSAAFSNGWASYGTDRFGATYAALDLTYAYTQLASERAVGLSGNVPVTLSAWIKPSTNTEGIWISGFGSLSNAMSAFALSLKNNTANGMRLFNYNPTGTGGVVSDQIVSSDLPTPLTGWNHVASVYSGSASNISLFLNGQLLASMSIRSASFSDQLSLSNTPIHVGVQPGQDISGNMKGMMDDVMIYNRALSTNEVSQLYASQSVPEPSTYALLFLGGAASLWVFKRRKS